MTQAVARIIGLIGFLSLDVLASWLILSAVGSFVMLAWLGAHETAFGRAVWLALFLYLAKSSIASAAEWADKHFPRVVVDAQPTTTA